MPRPTIREATEADLPQLVTLLAQLAPDVPQREDISSPLPYEYHMVMRQIIGTPGQHIFVLEVRGKIVGTAALSVLPNVSHRGTPYAIIENVVVDEKVRSKGYGELLMRHAIEEGAAGRLLQGLADQQQAADGGAPLLRAPGVRAVARGVPAGPVTRSGQWLVVSEATVPPPRRLTPLDRPEGMSLRQVKGR